MVVRLRAAAAERFKALTKRVGYRFGEGQTAGPPPCARTWDAVPKGVGDGGRMPASWRAAGATGFPCAPAGSKATSSCTAVREHLEGPIPHRCEGRTQRGHVDGQSVRTSGASSTRRSQPAVIPAGSLRLCLALGVMTWLVSACASLEPVQQFAAGVDGLARSSNDFYRMSAESDRRLRMSTVDLTEPWTKAVGGDEVLSEIRRHQAAVGALQAYARALNELATVSDGKEVEAAAKELGGALTSFSGTLTGSAPEEGILGGAIAAVGKAYVDLKARRAIKAAVTTAQPHVEIIVATLLEDAKRQRQRMGVARVNASARREKLYESLRTGSSEPAFRTLTAQQLVGDERDDLAIEPGQDLVLASFEEAAKACGAAHRALAQDRIGTEAVEAFVRRVSELVSAVQAFK